MTRQLIRLLAPEFTMRSECGSKNPRADVIAADWVAEMSGDLDAGVSVLTAESRESRTVGLYRPNGEVREDLVEALVAELPVAKIIFEAPRKASRPGSSAGSGWWPAWATSLPTR